MDINKMSHPKLVATATDERILGLYHLDSLLPYSIGPHPSSIWQVKSISQSNFVSVCESGEVR